MAALTASMISCPVAPVAAKPAKAGFNGLARVALPCKAAPSFAQKTVSNGCTTRQMLVWEPVDNKCAPNTSLLSGLIQWLRPHQSAIAAEYSPIHGFVLLMLSLAQS